jgi:acylphosphatase
VVRAHLLIYGRVQGVGFRSNARRIAFKLGLKGWIRNRSDGRVEAVIEGPENMIRRFIKWSHKGPTMSRVIKVEFEESESTGEFTSFSII